MELTSRLRALGSWHSLQFSEKAKFFRLSKVVILFGNISQLLGVTHTASLTALTNHETSFEVYEITAGLGCFCALATVVSSYDHTSKAYLLVNTLRRSASELLMYFLGLIPVVMAFTMLGMCWFWPSGAFLSVLDTWATLQCLMYGDSVAYFFGLGLSVDYFFAQVYFYSFIVLFICIMQNIIISYIRTAFHSIKEIPVSLIDDEAGYRENRLNSDGLSAPPVFVMAKEKLERLRSNRAFTQLLNSSLRAPVLSSLTEREENTQALLSESEVIAEQITSLMLQIQAKAMEDASDEQAKVRLREVVTVELPALLQESTAALR